MRGRRANRSDRDRQHEHGEQRRCAAIAARRTVCALAACTLPVLAAGCGASGDSRPAARPAAGVVRDTAARVAPVPVPAGRGPGFALPARGNLVARGRTVDGLRCTAGGGQWVLAHLELFARGRVVPIPPGIGVAPPLRPTGAYVRGGRCSYAIRTREPTGLLELQAGMRGRGLTLGQLFDLWGQPLSRTRLAGFHGTMRATVAGRRWRGDPRAIPLGAHAVLALAVGPPVPVHARYVFPRRR